MMPTPSVEAASLSPMLIVLGAAVAGVLVEAFRRASGAMPAAGPEPGRLVAAFAAVVVLARQLHETVGHNAVLGSSSSMHRRCSCRAPSCWSACWASCSSPNAVASVGGG